jgi:hypothetical protein
MPGATIDATRLARRLVVLTIVPLFMACGSSPAGPSGSHPTVTIGPTGVFPKELRIKAWEQVTFVNNDTRPHTMSSDPVDTHTQCPPINRVGLLLPGERRETGNLNLPRTCGYHDHDDHSNTAFHGRIIVE